MIRRLPIRVRVTAAFAIVMAAVLAGSGLFLYLRLGSHLATALDRNLRLRAQDLRAVVGTPGSSLAIDGTGGLVERGESYAELLSMDGHVVDATPTLDRVPLLTAEELSRVRRGPFYLDRARVPGLDEHSRMLVTSVTRDGVPHALVVGATAADRAETLGSFRTELLIAGPVALILASGAGYLLAGLSLNQVEAMRRRAAAISAATAGDRLPVPPTGDEIERLGATLNQMLDRLETALQRERDFVADAAHELRTPLAALRAELELALRHAGSPEELRAAVLRSSQEAERLGQLAEALLLIARSDRGQVPLRRELVDVDALFATVVSRFEWRADEVRKRVRATAADGLCLEGDPIRLEQALGNLVDNALRYGGDLVELRVSSADGKTELHVIDNGAGFPPDFLPQAFDRFTRADSARARGGTGLGLSIVRQIAEAHGGTARAANLGPAGADVWLSLPA